MVVVVVVIVVVTEVRVVCGSSSNISMHLRVKFKRRDMNKYMWLSSSLHVWQTDVEMSKINVHYIWQMNANLTLLSTRRQ